MEPSLRSHSIERALVDQLDATHVEIQDDSQRHAGHPGAVAGGGHFRVVVVSERFQDLSMVAAQRLVYEALGELMITDIHARQMRTLTPKQWEAARK